ncbi:hypothetical protein BDW02DRAFT_2665 [Decorospora gaudefroyi]|uniref:BTB domain-containing protein n=1 Tax=Decorospora gaudefroyi TaxID=184978 RepID=A0A6A5KTV2_9PLEO|nr:hypothetical protein BDW02DRAFT_2665 [Decorospora gaudefroyi]
MPKMRKLTRHICRDTNVTNYSDEVIRVLVGDPSSGLQRKTYLLHDSILSSGSRFFRDMLSQPQKRLIGEATEALCDEYEFPHRTIELNEDDDLFGRYVSLVYFDTIPIGDEPDCKWKQDQIVARDVAIHARYSKLFDMFMLCERLRDRQAKNKIIDAITRQSLLYYKPSPSSDPKFLVDSVETDGNPGGWCKVFPLQEEVKYIYQRTSSESMRRLLVDMWAYSPAYSY